MGTRRQGKTILRGARAGAYTAKYTENNTLTVRCWVSQLQQLRTSSNDGRYSDCGCQQESISEPSFWANGCGGNDGRYPAETAVITWGCGAETHGKSTSQSKTKTSLPANDCALVNGVSCARAQPCCFLHHAVFAWRPIIFPQIKEMLDILLEMQSMLKILYC